MAFEPWSEPVNDGSSRDRTVVRDYGDVQTHMRDGPFYAANAAYLAVAVKDGESALFWYTTACNAGITFA